jgi:hypothetical protein
MIEVAPSNIDFGKQFANALSESQKCVVSITGSIPSLQLTAPEGFKISLNNSVWLDQISMGALTDEDFDLYVCVFSNSKSMITGNVGLEGGDVPCFVDEDDKFIVDEDDKLFEDVEGGGTASISVSSEIVSFKIEPIIVNFGNVYAGQKSVPSQIRLFNLNSAYDLNIEEVVISDPFKFKIGSTYVSTISGFKLQKNTYTDIDIVVEPSMLGSIVSDFDITADFDYVPFCFVDEDDKFIVDEDDKLIEDPEGL